MADISILSKIVAYASNPPWAASMMLWNVVPPEVVPQEVTPPEVVPPEVGIPEVVPPEVAPTKVGPPEVGPKKVGPPEIEGSIFLAK